MTAIMGAWPATPARWSTGTRPSARTLRLGPETYAFDAPAPVIADARGNYPVPMPGITKAF